MSLKLNGSAVPYNELKLDFDKDLSLLGYYSLFTGVDNVNGGNNINRTEYSKGYTLFAFDLTPDLCSGNHLELVEQGTLELALQFKAALTNAVTCVVYLEYQKIIEITKNRKIVLDYSN